MRQSDDNRFIPITTINAGKGREVRPDIYYYTNQIVNFVMVGDPSGTDWVLIDADDVIVHLFRPEVRSFYNLERMWAFGDDADRSTVASG